MVNGTMRRVAIFLSVLDVHTNRAPIDGEVIYRKHYPGKFLDARNPECVHRERKPDVGFPNGRTTLVVRQITGAIARRIVAGRRWGTRWERRALRHDPLWLAHGVLSAAGQRDHGESGATA